MKNRTNKWRRLLEDLFESETKDEEDKIDSVDDLVRRRPNKERQHIEGHKRLMKDYLLENLTYDDHNFVRWFQLRKDLFLKIIANVENACPYFVQKQVCYFFFYLTSYVCGILNMIYV